MPRPYAGVFAPSQVRTGVTATLTAAVAVQASQFAATLREFGSMAIPSSPGAFIRIIDTEAKVASQVAKEGRLTTE